MNLRASAASGAFSFDVVSAYPQPEGARLLLVDDDPEVLGSLRRTLTDKSWDIVALRDPQEALQEVDAKRVDIVLTDMNMNVMSGATLLGAVQQRHPDVARIIMSGHTDSKAVLRAVPFAHQFLAKPLDTDVLRWTLRRACGLRKLLTSEAIRVAVGASNEMPAAPATYLKLKQLLRDPQVGLAEVSAVIERDVGVSARILQLVSSAFFGMPRRVTTVAAAVQYLGVETLRTLVLALEIVRMFREGGNMKGFSLDVLQRHSFISAKLARGFADDAFADDAFVAGMLHSIGQLILAERVPGRYAEALEHAMQLAARGARVVVNDLGGPRDGSGDGNRDMADAVVAEIAEAGGTAIANADSVAAREGADALVAQALDAWGRLDIVVNNAGITGAGNFAEPESYQLVYATHLIGTVNVLRAAWPHFLERDYGRVVNTTSGSVFGAAGSGDYASAKGGVFAFSRNLAQDHEHTNIKVNAIMPMAYTRMTAAIPHPPTVEWLEKWFAPEKVAPFVAYLCHESVPCTGETFTVGGGRAAHVVFAHTHGYFDTDASPESYRDHFDEVMADDDPLDTSGFAEFARYAALLPEAGPFA